MKISSKDLPVVCFVVTQHSESALSLCLRYSKTSCEATPPKKNPFPKTVNCQTVTLVTQKKSFLETVICYLLSVPQKNHFWKLSTVNCNAWELKLALSKKQSQSSCFKNPKPFFLSKNCNTVSCKNCKS